MGDGLLCAGTRQGPALSQQKGLFLPHGGGWRRRVAFFHSFRRAPERQTHPRSKPMFHLFQKRMRGTRWMKPALRAELPPRPPRAPGAGGGLAPFPPSLGPGQQTGSRLQSQGRDPSDSPPALPWRVLPEHSTSLTSAATWDPPAARAPGAASRASHLPPRPPPML